MKREEIQKYCDEYSWLEKEVGLHDIYISDGDSVATLIDGLIRYQKENKFKDGTIECYDDMSLTIRYYKPRSQKKIIEEIKNIKRNETADKIARENIEKVWEKNELAKYKELHKKYGGK